MSTSKMTLADGTEIEVEDVPIERDKIEAGLILSDEERERRRKPITPEQAKIEIERKEAFYEAIKDIEADGKSEG